MAELTSKTQLGGQIGDSHGNEEIGHVFSDGVYSWVEKLAWDQQVVEELPAVLRPKTIYSLIEFTGVSDIICRADGSVTSQVEYVDIAGQFLLDPNEINGWGPLGFQDNSNTHDLGDSDSAVWNRISGGIKRPYDVEILSMVADHYNTSTVAESWGWAIAHQNKVDGTNATTTSIVFNETVDNGGLGLRNYQNTANQKTNIDVTTKANKIVPAGDTIILGAAAPTAAGTNYYVRIMAGHIAIRRHFS